MTKQCPHHWTQGAPFISNWVQQTPPAPPWTPQSQPVAPNPIMPSTATLPIYTPLDIKQLDARTVIVSVSIPAESVFTLPTKALEIKKIRKNLKITQCRFFNFVRQIPGMPHDTPKLFLGGFVRKDIQYSEAVQQTATTVESVIKDFIVNIPISCVVDLGRTLVIPSNLFGKQAEYEYSDLTLPPSGFTLKDKLPSSDFEEFNVVNQQFLNLSPNCELIFCRINEMGNALDRIPLRGGPLDEGIFKTIQEKMIILIQFRLIFPSMIDPPTTGCIPRE
ncbi:CsxC family protein [Desulfosporosinus sp. SB140]|uniref:CsxC family protein n=1 Tax=Desulfosporosinus paludis TaxID=3115649 RepID=UPI0038907B8C